MIRKAVIPAAGWGTRFLPATKVLPKEMVTVVDRPAIHYVVEEAVRAGIEEIIVVTGRNKRAIEDYFDFSPELEELLRSRGKLELLKAVQEPARMAEIHYVRQREPRGLGDAVLTAQRLVGNEPFAVLLPDELFPGENACLAHMADIHAHWGGAVVAVQEVAPEQVHRYGVIAPGAGGRGGPPMGVMPVSDLVEKPALAEAPSNLAVIGRYILPPEIFAILAHLPPGRAGEVQLTDALRVLAGRDQVHAWHHTAERYDIGSRDGFLEANLALALQRPEVAPALRRFLDRTLARTRAAQNPMPAAAPAGKP